MLRNHKPSAHFVSPLAERSGPARRPAFNLRVFLRSGHRRGQELRQLLHATPFGEWMRHLVGFKEANAWRYIAWLDVDVEA
jgi:hypothetical protein